jgi:hypothetical protein
MAGRQPSEVEQHVDRGHVAPKAQRFAGRAGDAFFERPSLLALHRESCAAGSSKA